MAQPLIIDEIEVVVIDSVPTLKRKIPTGVLSYGGAKSWVGRPVLVRASAGGLSGWGLVRPPNPFIGETAAGVFAAVRDYCAPRLVGKNAFDHVELLRRCEAALPANFAALSALDLAMHDLVGKALGVPVYALLGGACRDDVALEWSVGLGDVDAMTAEARRAVERFGVPFVCVKVGPSERLAEDIAAVRAIRSSVGPDVHLGLDANTSYNFADAARLLDALQDCGITYFEQPFPVRAMDEMRLLRALGRTAILADESTVTKADALAIARNAAADVLGVKLYKCGGLRRCRDIAVIADGAGLRVNCAGTANGSYIEAVAAAHLCASVPNHAFGAEFIMGLPSVDPDPIVRNAPIDVAHGRCPIPNLPGLGIEIDTAAVAKMALTSVTVR